MTRYSPRERMEMVLAGERPDRFAASFWRHFYHKEHCAEGTAEAMLDFQREFHWDFMKINPRADYHVEDWGLKQEWSKDEFTKHRKSNFPVTRIEDWSRIQPLNLSAPVLAEHLKAVSLIRKGSGKELPLLMTVFTPLAIAGRMVEDDNLLAQHIREDPEVVLDALENITATFEKFATELRNAGADGLFFATTQWGSSNLIRWEDYEKLGVPFDLRVLKAAGDDAIHLFHVCSSKNFLKKLVALNYPVKMYNWDSDDPTNPSLDEGTEWIKDKAVVGGVDQNGWLLHSKPLEIGRKIDEMKARNNSARMIIGPSCSIPPEVPMGTLQMIRKKL